MVKHVKLRKQAKQSGTLLMGHPVYLDIPTDLLSEMKVSVSTVRMWVSRTRTQATVRFPRLATAHSR